MSCNASFYVTKERGKLLSLVGSIISKLTHKLFR